MMTVQTTANAVGKIKPAIKRRKDFIVENMTWWFRFGKLKN
jgi:hypothetical protein